MYFLKVVNNGEIVISVHAWCPIFSKYVDDKSLTTLAPSPIVGCPVVPPVYITILGTSPSLVRSQFQHAGAERGML